MHCNVAADADMLALILSRLDKIVLLLKCINGDDAFCLANTHALAHQSPHVTFLGNQIFIIGVWEERV